MSSARPAAFLDRDGTIIHDADYLRDPEDVRLLPGAAHAIAQLNASGIPVVVVTNQSALARGLMTEQDYERVRARVDDVLAAEGARIDATYYCPHHPDFTGPCDCRKPGTLLYRRAADEHGLDLRQSLYVGDRWRDVAPGVELGGRGILIPNSWTPGEDIEQARARAELATSAEEAIARWLNDLVPARAPGSRR